MSTFNEGLGIIRRIQKEEFMGISTSGAANISTISYTIYNISTSAPANISSISYTMYNIITSALANISTISYTMYNISTSVAATAIYSIYGHKYFCNIQVPYKYCTICNIQA